VNNPDLSRWPNLKLPTHSALDWHETLYSRPRLLELAKTVSENPHPIQTRTPEGLPGVEDLAIESVLRALANSPAALKALNRRRPTPPRRVVGLNRAVHYIVRLEIRGKNEVKRALADVARAWGAKVSTIEEDRTDHHVEKRDPFAPTDAHFIAEQIIAGCSINRRLTRAAVLKAFDADMRNRAKQLRAVKK
jgi:hypothetical protein